MVTEEARSVTSRAFSTYWIPLETVKYFKYLRKMISVADDDWTTVLQNLVKARTVWW